MTDRLLPEEIFIDTDMSDNFYSLKDKSHRTKYTRANSCDKLVEALAVLLADCKAEIKTGTLSQKIFAIEKAENAISEYKAAPVKPHMPDDVREAVKDCKAHVNWKNGDASLYTCNPELFHPLIRTLIREVESKYE